MAWRFALLKCVKDPSKVIFEDEMATVIEDAYPKAEKHFLVVSKKEISKVSDVREGDLELIKAMDRIGREIAEEKGEGRTFKFGYHAEPSMERLHLHVISDDLNSPSLKNLKHWNSFTTEFFIDSKNVIVDLEKKGKVDIPDKTELTRLLKTPLKCHKCNFKPKNLPNLKIHIKQHLKTV